MKKYLKNLAIKSVTVFSYFVGEDTRKKIPPFFVYLVLFCLMFLIAVFGLVKFIFDLVMENPDGND